MIGTEDDEEKSVSSAGVPRSPRPAAVHPIPQAGTMNTKKTHTLIYSAIASALAMGATPALAQDEEAMSNALERMGFNRYKTLRMYDRPL